MKEEILHAILNLFKVKSILTIMVGILFVYLAVNGEIEQATSTAIIVMVFQSLFNKKKGE